MVFRLTDYFEKPETKNVIGSKCRSDELLRHWLQLKAAS